MAEKLAVGGGSVRIPLRVTVTNGESGSLLEILSVPVLVPGEVDENNTLNPILSPGAMVSGARGTNRNSAELDEILSITKGSVPLFLSHTNRREVVPPSTSPKSRVLLESESTAPIPVADKDTVEGLPDALWTRERMAFFVPAEVGAKVNVTIRAAAPTLTVKMVGDTVNCEASAPLTVIPVTSNVALPVFDTVKIFCEVDPTFVLSITTDEPDKLITGTPIPVPLNDTADGLPDALWTMERVAVFVPAEVGAKVTVTTCAAAPTLTVKAVGDTVKKSLESDYPRPKAGALRPIHGFATAIS